MRVSVIIPHYEDHARLERALESVRLQTLPAHEVIVVDDGSVEPPRVDAWLLTTPRPRSGPAVARNLGVEAATGDAIAFLDSDDVWFVRKLAAQRDALCDTGAAWSYTDCYYLGPRGLFRRPNSWFHGWPGALPSGRSIHAAHLNGHNFITMSSVMVRREACPRFDVTLPVSEDWAAWTELAAREPGVAVNEALHAYRLTPTGRHVRGLSEYVRVNLAILRKLHAPAPVPQEATERVYQRAAIQCLNAGRTGDAHQLLMKAGHSGRTIMLCGASLVPPLYRAAVRMLAR